MDEEHGTAQRPVKRRLVLQMLGKIGAMPIAGALIPTLIAETTGRAAATTEKEPNGRTRQWVLIFDLRKCEGCVTTDKAPQCIEACNAEHFVPKGQEWIKVFEVESPGGHTYFLPRPCMQCENPPCLNVCPVGATYKNAEGVILVNHDRCIGCRMCMAACPYAARVFNWEQPQNPPGATFANYKPEFPVPHRQGTVEKCMLCAHRTKDGKLPACAEHCPMFAVYLGDLTEDIATNGKEVVKLSLFLSSNMAYRLKEELGTRPRVFYIPGHGQDSGHDMSMHREPMPARSWEEQGATLTSSDGGH
ncbi:MAG TPA: 4Fe-4S dicluster domain-containing protein [Anaerolineae bacterium]|jgi:molybdopterin-containing oxidoreductase family iron-sulfur binding subunit